MSNDKQKVAESASVQITPAPPAATTPPSPEQPADGQPDPTTTPAEGAAPKKAVNAIVHVVAEVTQHEQPPAPSNS